MKCLSEKFVQQLVDNDFIVNNSTNYAKIYRGDEEKVRKVLMGSDTYPLEQCNPILLLSLLTPAIFYYSPQKSDMIIHQIEEGEDVEDAILKILFEVFE